MLNCKQIFFSFFLDNEARTPDQTYILQNNKERLLLGSSEIKSLKLAADIKQPAKKSLSPVMAIVAWHIQDSQYTV